MDLRNPSRCRSRGAPGCQFLTRAPDDAPFERHSSTPTSDDAPIPILCVNGIEVVGVNDIETVDIIGTIHIGTPNIGIELIGTADIDTLSIGIATIGTEITEDVIGIGTEEGHHARHQALRARHHAPGADPPRSLGRQDLCDIPEDSAHETKVRGRRVFVRSRTSVNVA